MKFRNYPTKIIFSTLLLVVICIGFSIASQGLPPVMVRTPAGFEVDAAELGNGDKPFVVSFWASWCRPCLQELHAIGDIYDEWLSHGFKLIAISTDDARTKANVLPMIHGRGWEFEFYLDENGDLRRALGVNQIPHTFVFSADGKVVYQHTGFTQGIEFDLLEKMIELTGDN